MAELYAADPINQFNRLIEVSSGKIYELGSPWNNVRYVNGVLHDFDSENCTCSMGAVARDFETGGADKSSPAEIRNHQGDFNGGIGPDDVAEAWARLGWGTLAVPQSADWGDLMTLARGNRFIEVAVDYRYVPWTYQEQKGGSFDHALGFSHPRSDGSILRYDSLGRAPRRVPQSAVRPAAEALSKRLGVGASRLFCFYTKPGKLVTSSVIYLFGGEPRFRGAYLSRQDNLPVRSRPEPTAPKVAELDHRESFACRQSVVRNGQPAWLGTADGRKWVYAERMWYQGGITGEEKVK